MGSSPADALLTELEAREPLGSAEVMALEEHVEYWHQHKLDWLAIRRKAAQRQSLHPRNGGGRDGRIRLGTWGNGRQEIARAAAIKKTKMAISEISPVYGTHGWLLR